MPKTTKTTKPATKRAPKQKRAAEQSAKPIEKAKRVKKAKAVKPANPDKQLGQVTAAQASDTATAPEIALDAALAPEAVSRDEPAVSQPPPTEQPGDAADSTAETAAEQPEAVVEAPLATAEAPPASAESAPATAELPAAGQLESPRNRRTSAKYLIFLGVLLLLVAAGLKLYTHAHPDSSAAAAQNKSLVAEVAERVVLPTGETPTITTVVDKTKVNQAFLANVMDGDKVLLYFQAGKAIVYRPSTHQVVNIGPLQQPVVKIFLRSGTPGGQIPASIRSELNLPAEYSIVSQDVSAKPDYTKTLVIDLTGNRPDIAARVAKTIGGQVAGLPSGETSPDADILIIVGSQAK